jgi:hypothetical protein
MEGVEIIMEEYEVLFHWHNIDQMIYQDLGPRRQQRRQHPADAYVKDLRGASIGKTAMRP